MTTPTEDARRRVRTQLDLQLADDHEFVMIERCDAEALIEPSTEDEMRECLCDPRFTPDDPDEPCICEGVRL